MIIDNAIFNDMLNSPVRALRGRLEIYEGSSLTLICGCHDRLKSFTIERVGEQSKFFGFGVCQKLNAHLIDKDRELNITTANSLEVEFGVGSNYIYPCPNFYVTEVNRNEKTNELSITAYDALYKAADHKVAELDLPRSYTILEFAEACAALLGLPLAANSLEPFGIYYAEGANFEGTESIREALNAIAEATQTIYYINNKWELCFRRLAISGAADLTINKEKYIELDSKTNKRLASIASVTELGDNVSASLAISGSTQYIRDNPFLELREDIAELLENALAAIGGLTINQFNCSWRGNFLLEIGDKIGLITKDNELVFSYVLDDVFSFDGSLSGKTQWSYTDDGAETESNPTTLGEALKQTYARVDKANKQIEMLVSETSANSAALSELKLTTEGINATVSKVEAQAASTTEEMQNLTRKVEASITAEDVRIEIQTELENGVDKVITGKGYALTDEGLTIEDINPESNNDIKTTVSNNGMKVFSNDETVLTANDAGVKAKDLHANTYLIIGNNSRFEDYGSNRTGCFWIG